MPVRERIVMTDAWTAVTRIRTLTADQLSQFFAIDSIRAWSAEDSVAALEHQLNAPLLPDLLGVSALTRPQLIAEVERSGATSFLLALTQPTPSTVILETIQNFARDVGADSNNPLCGAAATLLYYAASATGLSKCHLRMGDLLDADLKRGFQWALQQPGADALKTLFEDGLEHLAGR